MYNDMLMNDMAEYLSFSKKWMMGLAMIMQKGITIKIIHNLDRPLDEMMLGLEGCIPLYMTGLVSPYYLSRTNNDVFCRFRYLKNIRCRFFLRIYSAKKGFLHS